MRISHPCAAQARLSGLAEAKDEELQLFKASYQELVRDLASKTADLEAERAVTRRLDDETRNAGSNAVASSRGADRASFLDEAGGGGETSSLDSSLEPCETPEKADEASESPRETEDVAKALAKERSKRLDLETEVESLKRFSGDVYSRALEAAADESASLEASRRSALEALNREHEKRMISDALVAKLQDSLEAAARFEAYDAPVGLNEAQVALRALEASEAVVDALRTEAARTTKEIGHVASAYKAEVGRLTRASANDDDLARVLDAATRLAQGRERRKGH